MLKVDLQHLLLKSKQSKVVLHEHKQFILGKERYCIIYDLIDTAMIIKQIKHITKAQNLEKRLRKRREFFIRSQRTVKFNAKKLVEEQGEDLVVTQICNASTQTEYFTIDSTADTYDLIRTVSKLQQTYEITLNTQGAQTLPPDVDSIGTQKDCESFVASSQTDYITFDESESQTDHSESFDDIFNYYFEKITECQENHTILLTHMNALIADVCKIIQVHCDFLLLEMTKELSEAKEEIISLLEEIANNFNRDKMYLKNFYREDYAFAAAIEVSREMMITEISVRETQTDIQEQASKSTQTRKPKSKFCCFSRY